MPPSSAPAISDSAPPASQAASMVQRLQARNPGRKVWAILFYEIIHALAQGILTLFFRLRRWNEHLIPATGPLLVIANHQSHLDPPLVSMGLRRRHLNFIARSTLFGWKPFGEFIRLLNSIPLNQNAADSEAMRTALAQLAMGRAILIFPEGSRTPDGAMHPFKRGMWLLVTRGKCTVLPMAIEGCYDAWPRRRRFPFLTGHQIAVIAGQPVPCEELLKLGPDAGLRMLEQRVEALRLNLAERLTKGGNVITTSPMSSRIVD